MLELGSGGGNNASHMKDSFKLTLTDLSEDMLNISRRLNPECEHIRGDMRTCGCNGQIRCVFIQDAISYIKTVEDLRRTLETAFIHCKKGGVALFAPDYTRETFKPSTRHGGHDGDDHGMRYLEWTWTQTLMTPPTLRIFPIYSGKKRKPVVSTNATFWDFFQKTTGGGC